MKRIFLGPQGPPSYIGKWTENGLRMIERWINTLVEFRGATADRDGSDGVVPQPKAGDENKALFGDGKWRTLGSSGGTPPPPGSIPIYDLTGNPVTDVDFRYDPTTDTLYAPHIEALTVVADTVTVDPEVYGVGWDGDNSVPTKNDVYDKIESMASGGGGAVAVPVFWNNISIIPAAGFGLQYEIVHLAVAVLATTKLVWINAIITGSGTKRKKRKKRGKATVWTFDMQLKNSATGTTWSLGTVTASIPANSKQTSFKLPIIGAISRLPVASYHLMLVSSLLDATPGTLTVNVVGQAP
jgi:hypothetical protein